MFVMKDLCGNPLDQNYLQQVSLLVGGAAQAIETCSEDELEQHANAIRAGKMTSGQHEAKSKSLERLIAKKRSAKKAAGALAEKLSIDREIKALQEALRQHRLNYFELVAN